MVFGVATLAANVVPAAAQRPAASDAFETLLHASSLDQQRTALATIASDRRAYLPRLRQSLRDYARLVVSDPQASLRAVTLATYLNDIAFAGILLESIGNTDVEAGCASPCPVSLALAVHAAFGEWHVPLDINPGLPSVSGFQSVLARISPGGVGARPPSPDSGESPSSSQSLPSSLPSSPPALPDDADGISGQPERQLIVLAGPATPSGERRLAAARALATSVTTSTRRRDLYLLAMNPPSGEAAPAYLGAVYEAIYRAEFARVHGR